MWLSKNVLKFIIHALFRENYDDNDADDNGYDDNDIDDVDDNTVGSGYIAVIFIFVTHKRHHIAGR